MPCGSKANNAVTHPCRVGKVYEWLGLTVGVVVSATEHSARRPAFEADVTFITAQELCFTFLRDQTVDNEQRIVRLSWSVGAADGCSSILACYFLVKTYWRLVFVAGGHHVRAQSV